MTPKRKESGSALSADTGTMVPNHRRNARYAEYRGNTSTKWPLRNFHEKLQKIPKFGL